MASKQQTSGIVNPHDHDVLSGRGNFVNYHAGNEHFRALVRKHKLEYVRCPKPQKGKFSRMIVDEIKNRTPPGRFLKQDNSTKLWYDIGEKKALDKTRQALREGAPDIVKELNGEGAVSDDEPLEGIGTGEDGLYPLGITAGLGGAGFTGTDAARSYATTGMAGGMLPSVQSAGLNTGLTGQVMASSGMMMPNAQLSVSQMQALTNRQMQQTQVNALRGQQNLQRQLDELKQQVNPQMALSNARIGQQGATGVAGMQGQGYEELEALQNRLNSIYNVGNFEPRPIESTMPSGLPGDNPRQSTQVNASQQMASQQQQQLRQLQQKQQSLQQQQQQQLQQQQQRPSAGSAVGQNPRRQPPPSLLKRDDSLKMEKVFSADGTLVSPTPSKMKFDGNGSSAHMSAMSLSIGDMGVDDNLSSVFDSSLRISDKEKNTSKSKRSSQETTGSSIGGTSSNWDVGHNMDMSVNTFGVGGISENGEISQATFENKMLESEGNMSFSKVFDDPDKAGI